MGPVLQRPPRRRVRRPLGGGERHLGQTRRKTISCDGCRWSSSRQGGLFQNISLRVREGVSLFLGRGLGQMDFAQPLGQRVLPCPPPSQSRHSSSSRCVWRLVVARAQPEYQCLQKSRDRSDGRGRMHSDLDIHALSSSIRAVFSQVGIQDSFSNPDSMNP